MKKLFVVIGIFILSHKSFAGEFDSYVDAAARSYSLGVSVTPNFGYKIPLWGEVDSPFRGILRPSVIPSLTGASYGGRTELEFSPVAFIGLAAGRSWVRRFSSFDEDNCGKYNCVGSMNSTDVSFKFLFKYSVVFGYLKYTRMFYDTKSDKSQQMIDHNNYLLVSAVDEIANQFFGVTGFMINDKWSAGAIAQLTDLEKNKRSQNAQYLFASLKHENIMYVGAAGRFESQLKPAKPSVLLTVKYSWQ